MPNHAPFSGLAPRAGAWAPSLRCLGFVAIACGTLATAGAATRVPPPPASRSSAGSIALQRFVLPGPVAGVMARVDLRDPRVSLNLVLADGPAAGATADCTGRLDVPSAVARRHDFAVAVNASYFSAAAKEVGGRKVHFFVGNCATPVGWHAADGKVRTRPTQAHIQATLVVHADGRLSMHPSLEQLPAVARCSVSGNALVVAGGQVIRRPADGVRHPRTAVGVSRDGGTLLLVAVDGRQEHSRGVSLAELGELMKGFGAHDALNLDGGGSTALVAKDHATGVFAVANRPSDLALEFPELRVERPVVDVLGVVVREAGSSPMRH